MGALAVVGVCAWRASLSIVGSPIGEAEGEWLELKSLPKARSRCSEIAQRHTAHMRQGQPPVASHTRGAWVRPQAPDHGRSIPRSLPSAQARSALIRSTWRSRCGPSSLQCGGHSTARRTCNHLVPVREWWAGAAASTLGAKPRVGCRGCSTRRRVASVALCAAASGLPRYQLRR